MDEENDVRRGGWWWEGRGEEGVGDVMEMGGEGDGRERVMGGGGGREESQWKEQAHL